MPAGLRRYGTASGNTASCIGSRAASALWAAPSPDPITIEMERINRMIPPATAMSRSKMQQPGQELAQDDQDQPDRSRSYEHLARDLAFVASSRSLVSRRRHEGDLRPDPDQQEEEDVDHDVDIDGVRIGCREHVHGALGRDTVPVFSSSQFANLANGVFRGHPLSGDCTSPPLLATLPRSSCPSLPHMRAPSRAYSSLFSASRCCFQRAARRVPERPHRPTPRPPTPRRRSASTSGATAPTTARSASSEGVTTAPSATA